MDLPEYNSSPRNSMLSPGLTHRASKTPRSSGLGEETTSHFQFNEIAFDVSRTSPNPACPASPCTHPHISARSSSSSTDTCLACVSFVLAQRVPPIKQDWRRASHDSAMRPCLYAHATPHAVESLHTPFSHNPSPPHTPHHTAPTLHPRRRVRGAIQQHQRKQDQEPFPTTPSKPPPRRGLPPQAPPARGQRLSRPTWLSLRRGLL